MYKKRNSPARLDFTPLLVSDYATDPPGFAVKLFVLVFVVLVVPDVILALGVLDSVVLVV